MGQLHVDQENTKDGDDSYNLTILSFGDDGSASMEIS